MSNDNEIAYHYTGKCPCTGQILFLPRTPDVEEIAHHLMATLATENNNPHDGKMYGVLLAEDSQGQRQALKAFSGLLNQQAVVEGWVPPIPGREQVAFTEAQTLAKLNHIRDQVLKLISQLDAVNHCFQARSQAYAIQWQQLTQTHTERKQARDQQRQQAFVALSGDSLQIVLATVEEESRWDGRERRHFKRDRNAALAPLREQQAHLQGQLQTLKQQRKSLSRQLQVQMHHSYWLSNFAGESVPLHHLYDGGMPTGTGECCAPKLLHYAATQGLKPLAMAEFWWGDPQGDKVPGQFYGACAERCQPLMGFLLSGLSSPLPHAEITHPALISSEFSPQLAFQSPLSRIGVIQELPILYDDAWLVAVDKPTGILSVPGRNRQDNILWRLQQQLGISLWAVHRLDQDTSGVLLLARDQDTYRQLNHAFQARQVEKYYEAVLSGQIQDEFGMIDLPLWGDPGDRPRQSVNWQNGKPSQTRFWRLEMQCDRTHVRFQPITGRTHQLRVHASDPQGLGVPILGDRIYGDPRSAARLHLHATALRLQHPQTGMMLDLRSAYPIDDNLI
jgi:tRNA pseudouridine32 synthase / 23S rRNA pseudouridine746 synthase